MTDTFYFITHPNVVIDPSVPVPRWPLSDHGRERMRKGLRQPWIGDLGAIYCSTEQKAMDAAHMLGEHCGLDVVLVHALGENDRSATGFRPPPEFERLADRFFSEPQRSVEGWETAANAQARIVAAVTGIAHVRGSQRRPDDDGAPLAGDAQARSRAVSGNRRAAAIVSHGAVGALLYCHLAGEPIDRRRDQPPNGGGNYFVFTLSPPRVHGGWLAIDVV